MPFRFTCCGFDLCRIIREEDKPTKQGKFKIAMVCAMSGQQLLLGPSKTKAGHAMIDGLHTTPAQLDLHEVNCVVGHVFVEELVVLCLCFQISVLFLSKGFRFPFLAAYLMA